MKITGPNSIGSSVAGQGGKRPQGLFRIGGGEELSASGVTRATAAAGVGSIDALIALQQVEEPLVRRRRAVGRAGRLLDLLDQVKLGILDGGLSQTQLNHLAAVVREERATTGDPGLDGLLDQIETRAKVELAKIEARAKAA